MNNTIPHTLKCAYIKYNNKKHVLYYYDNTQFIYYAFIQPTWKIILYVLMTINIKVHSSFEHCMKWLYFQTKIT